LIGRRFYTYFPCGIISETKKYTQRYHSRNNNDTEECAAAQELSKEEDTVVPSQQHYRTFCGSDDDDDVSTTNRSNLPEHVEGDGPADAAVPSTDSGTAVAGVAGPDNNNNKNGIASNGISTVRRHILDNVDFLR
jgi:hypothetical protein